jgi:hypothetical protein
LVVLHVAAGLAVAAAFANDPAGYSLAGVAFLATFFAQSGLLGILAALGTQPLWARLIIAAIGLCCAVGDIVWVAAPGETIFLGLLATNTAVVAGVLGILRRRGLSLHRLDAEDRQNLAEPFHFGIRHLMAWIFATAAVLRVGQSLDPHGTLGILFAYGLSFAAVAVAAPWAALGSRRPVTRSALVALAAGLMGMVGPMYERDYSTERLFFFVMTTVTDAVILLVSLWLLRRTGLRVVRRETTGPIQETAALEEPRC